MRLAMYGSRRFAMKERESLGLMSRESGRWAVCEPDGKLGRGRKGKEASIGCACEGDNGLYILKGQLQLNLRKGKKKRQMPAGSRACRKSQSNARNEAGNHFADVSRRESEDDSADGTII